MLYNLLAGAAAASAAATAIATQRQRKWIMEIIFKSFYHLKLVNQALSQEQAGRLSRRSQVAHPQRLNTGLG